jgi:hypothetical protein
MENDPIAAAEMIKSILGFGRMLIVATLPEIESKASPVIPPRLELSIDTSS